MRVAIVGSRNFPHLDLVRSYVDALPDNTIIISGGARGVDQTAEEQAKKRGFLTVIFQAEWDRFGRRAGYLRNVTIVTQADRVVAFWDGKSKGTKHSMDLARSQGKPLITVTTTDDLGSS